MSEEPEELACFTAFYKLWQNAGAFSSFLLGVFAGSYVVDFWTNIALLLALIGPTFLAMRSVDAQAAGDKKEPEVCSSSTAEETDKAATNSHDVVELTV